MSANPPQLPETPEPNDIGEIKLYLAWIRQDLNGVLEQQKLTNGRVGKSEAKLNDLDHAHQEAIKEHAAYSASLQELAVLKGQISLIISLLKYSSVIIVLLNIAGILLNYLEL